MNAPERPFDEPWQAQAFAIAVSLNERGLFSWSEWTRALGAELARAHERTYYEVWLDALEALLRAKKLAGEGELEALADAWKHAAEATPHGQPIRLDAER